MERKSCATCLTMSKRADPRAVQDLTQKILNLCNVYVLNSVRARASNSLPMGEVAIFVTNPGTKQRRNSTCESLSLTTSDLTLLVYSLPSSEPNRSTVLSAQKTSLKKQPILAPFTEPISIIGNGEANQQTRNLKPLSQNPPIDTSCRPRTCQQSHHITVVQRVYVRA